MWTQLLPAGDLPVPGTDADEARRLATEVLQGDEFRTNKSVLARILDWIAGQLTAGTSSGGGGGGGVGSIVGGVILVAALAVVLWVLVRGIRALRSAGPVRSRRRGRRRAQVEVTTRTARPSTTREDWRAEADRLEAEGQLDLALLARYRAIVSDLVDVGVLENVAGRTPSEFRLDVRSRAPGAATEFDLVTDRFEAVWYGPASAVLEDLAAFRQADPVILASLGDDRP